MTNEKWIEYRCTPPCNKLLCKYKPSENYAFEIKCTRRTCHNINYRGSVISLNLEELRCPNVDPRKSEKAGKPVKCNKLLARILPGTHIQVKCSRCKALIETDPQTGKALVIQSKEK